MQLMESMNETIQRNIVNKSGNVDNSERKKENTKLLRSKLDTKRKYASIITAVASRRSKPSLPISSSPLVGRVGEGKKT